MVRLTEQVEHLSQALSISKPSITPISASPEGYRTNAAGLDERQAITQAIASIEGTPIEDDDIEDEPDEILYDFLPRPD